MRKIFNEPLFTSDLEKVCEDCFDELQALSGQNLLITGAAGFLGYYFAAVICFWNSQQKEKIICTLQDNFIRGRPVWLNDLKKHHDFRVEKRDVTKKYVKFEFQNVIHAASIASPTFYRKYPIETMDANVIGLRNLLEAQNRFKLESNIDTRFLYFSTSEIYGDPTKGNIPTPEEYRGNVSCTGPRACYDESKRYGETLCVNFSKSRSLHTTIARPFNNYGPGLKLTDRRVIPDFVRSAKETQKITLLSDGSPTRTFCFISDAISGYIKTLVRGVSGQSYNIGTDQPEVSMLQLAELMKEIYATKFNMKLSIEHMISSDVDYLTDNPNRRCPNITKARNEIGFSPRVSLAEGLYKTITWYEND